MNGSKTIQTNEKGAGGLYKNVKIPVRALNAFILLSLAALLAVTVYLTLHGGYTVEFDSAGGSSVESVRLKFGDSIPFPDAPVKEGYRFAGWYQDEALTQRWDFSQNLVQGPTRLYAAWQPQSSYSPEA